MSVLFLTTLHCQDCIEGYMKLFPFLWKSLFVYLFATLYFLLFLTGQVTICSSNCLPCNWKKEGCDIWGNTVISFFCGQRDLINTKLFLSYMLGGFCHYLAESVVSWRIYSTTAEGVKQSQMHKGRREKVKLCCVTIVSKHWIDDKNVHSLFTLIQQCIC